MTRNVRLNNVDHHDIAVRVGPDPVTGEVPVFPTEVEALHREYPLLLRREGDQWQLVALIGLEPSENLYLSLEGRWDARAIPALAQRGPFSIGLVGEEGEPMIHLDLDDPRVARAPQPGHAPLFLPRGGNSPYLDHMADVLRRIHLGHQAAGSIHAAWAAAGVIEPLTLQVPLGDSVRYDLTGFHAIDRERLDALPGAELEALGRAGALGLAFLVAASIGNVQRLADAKRRRVEAA